MLRNRKRHHPYLSVEFLKSTEVFLVFLVAVSVEKKNADSYLTGFFRV